MTATQAERRSTIDHKLFEITDEIKEGLEKLLEKEVSEYFTSDTKEKRVSVLAKKLDVQ